MQYGQFALGINLLHVCLSVVRKFFVATTSEVLSDYSSSFSESQCFTYAFAVIVLVSILCGSQSLVNVFSRKCQFLQVVVTEEVM